MEYICPAFVLLFFLAFGVIFVYILTTVLVTIVRSIAVPIHNNSQPINAYSARLVAKRTSTSGMDSVSTWYYLTFESQSGERREYSVSGSQYGMVAEGDCGTLVVQGTRFHQFQRDPSGYR